MQVPALSMSRTHTDRGCEARGSSCLSSGNPVSGTVIYSTTCILCVSKLWTEVQGYTQVFQAGHHCKEAVWWSGERQASYLGLRYRCCRYLSKHSPSAKTPCFRVQADSSSIVMPNPSSELHPRPCTAVPLHDTLFLHFNP